MSEQKIIEIINNDDLYKISISNPWDKKNPIKNIVGRQIEIKNSKKYQFEFRTENKVKHSNLDLAELIDYLVAKLAEYKQIYIIGKQWEYQIIVKKDKSIKVNKQKNKNIFTEKILNEGIHNKKKNYILKEGDKIPIFIELGIFTDEYRIVNQMYDKFRQINRFVELVDDVAKKVFANKKIIRILDFGCGKSYLTFVLYHYFKEIRNKEVEIIGIDLKSEIIDKCNYLVAKYNYEGLQFIKGDVGNLQVRNLLNSDKDHIDMVVSLHACDIATDFALINAVKWQSEVIFSVPCCQHELNSQMGKDILPIMLKHGILKERFSAMLTDSLRCSILNICDYKTDLVEFVDLAHSPKNLLIRAYKTKYPQKFKEAQYQEIIDTLQTFKIEQKLFTELIKGDYFNFQQNK